jgi:hypothetical protein
MLDPVYMPPDEWIREWSKPLLNKEISKGEASRSIAKNSARWGFNKGLDVGKRMGAAQELEECCAQINQCHMIPAEQREKIAEYLHEIRSAALQR